jgi:hypothetical protein
MQRSDSGRQIHERLGASSTMEASKTLPWIFCCRPKHRLETVVSGLGLEWMHKQVLSKSEKAAAQNLCYLQTEEEHLHLESLIPSSVLEPSV